MPDYADAHGNLAITLMKEGGAEMRRFFILRKKCGWKPNDPNDARLNLGLALTEQNKPGEAAAQFSEVLRAHPESALAHYRLAIAAHAGGQISASHRRMPRSAAGCSRIFQTRAKR